MSDQQSPYEALADLAGEELELARRGRFGALPDLYARRRALIAALPDRPPLEARAALERAATAQEQAGNALAGALAEVRSELERARRGRSAARSYGRAAMRAPARPR